MPTTVLSENTSGADFTGLSQTWMHSGDPDGAQAGEVSDFVGRDSSNGYRLLIRPSGLSNITGPVTVTAASLQLYQTGQSAAMNAELWAVVRNWVLAEATWNSYSTGNSWATAGGLGSGDVDATNSGAYAMAESTGSYVTLTLAGDALQNLEDWINGARTNNGWLIKPETDTATRYRIVTSDGGTDGQRPILSVTYDVAGGATVRRLVNGGLINNGLINGGLIR